MGGATIDPMRSLLLIACALEAGCLQTSEPDPMPRLAEVQLLGGTQGHTYDLAVAAGPDAFLVTWTEHRVHDGDTSAAPDIFYHHADPIPGTHAEGTPLAAYERAQLQSRPFCSQLGCGVAWGDDAPAGFPDRRVLWRLLDGGAVASYTDARVTTLKQTHQRSATRVEVVGSRALVAYAVAAETEQVWHASLLDLASGSVAREIELHPQSWKGLHSVTAGRSTFLVLQNEAIGERQRLVAFQLDAEGTRIAGPIVLGERLPSDLPRPLTAGYHDGEFIIPVLDYDVVEVDRPCCPLCTVVQPPTCTIEDYHVYLIRLSERDATTSEAVCLDCRTDVGVHVPLVASAADGAYFFWGDLVARATAVETPPPASWRRVVFPEPEGALVSRELHDAAARTGEVVLVGRQRDLAAPGSFEQAFAARIVY